MIRLLGRKPAARPLDDIPISIGIAGEQVPVIVRHSVRARRYGIRIESASGQIILTIPQYGNYDEAIRFLTSHEGWLTRRLKSVDGPVPFEHGAEFPLRDTPCRIEAMTRVRGVVRLIDDDDGKIVQVPGGNDHAARRLTEWLKAEARSDLEAAVARHAAKIEKRPSRITVRDTSTRWGSCSARGALSFSWRLILAPPHVLDYVAAHEVAHLVHMNHSAKFWALTRTLFPQSDNAEAWLKRHGRGLHRYGRMPAS